MFQIKPLSIFTFSSFFKILHGLSKKIYELENKRRLGGGSNFVEKSI